MTILNDEQQHLLSTVEETYEAVLPVLRAMQHDYEYAIYRAKNPIREAVDIALEGGVPMSRIVTEATDLHYPQKLKAWLRPAESVVERLLGDDVQIQVAEAYEEDLDKVQTVTRDPRTGEFSVHFKGTTHTVRSAGSDAEPWATRAKGMPQGVYDLISEKYAGFAVLEDEDD